MGRLYEHVHISDIHQWTNCPDVAEMCRFQGENSGPQRAVVQVLTLDHRVTNVSVKLPVTESPGHGDMSLGLGDMSPRTSPRVQRGHENIIDLYEDARARARTYVSRGQNTPVRCTCVFAHLCF